MFPGLIGHKALQGSLKNLVLQEQGGCYLFRGPPSVGKRTFAFSVSKQMLCLGDGAEDCSCDSCKLFPEVHPDFITMGQKNRIKVENVDKFKDFISLHPFISKRRVVILDNAEMMTESSSNRLLKVIEEPFLKFTFFLITSDSNKMLPTIRSRCVPFDFKPLTQEDIVNILWKKLGFDLEKSQILGWIGSSTGLDIFKNASVFLSERETALDFIQGAKRRGLVESLHFLDRIGDLPTFIQMLRLLLGDIQSLQNEGFIVNTDLKDTLSKITFNPKALILFLNRLDFVTKHSYLNVNIRMRLVNQLLDSYDLLKIKV